MAQLVKFLLLVCSALAVSAGPVGLNNYDTENALLDDLLDTFAETDQSKEFGLCQPSDKLLHSDTVSTAAGLLLQKHAEVRYPFSSASQGGVISCIKVTDILKDGNNGSFDITSGGIGERSVVINFTGTLGYRMRYIVEIYGNQ